MANTRDIRRRIRSVRNTSQITRAMQMVAASKMRRAQDAALAGRPYSRQMFRILLELREQLDEELHPMLAVRPVRGELVLVLSTDKGLCGALNSNLFRELLKFDVAKTDFVVCGRKARQFLARTGRNIIADFPVSDRVTFAEARSVARFCLDRFLSAEDDRVTVVLPHYINTLSQRPIAVTLLPISPMELLAQKSSEASPGLPEGLEYLLEPSPARLLEAILPHAFNYQIYIALLDARASEHSARMVAMKNATDNARDLIERLTLEYNKIRQAGITKEIQEIATAQIVAGD
jgi:F-type H+-transporting ATPase subunit gamma